MSPSKAIDSFVHDCSVLVAKDTCIQCQWDCPMMASLLSNVPDGANLYM